MEYINDMSPGSHLLPASVEDRAKVRMVTEIVASGIQPHQVRILIIKHIYSTHFQNAARNFEDQTKREAWSKGWITKGFRALEEVRISSER